MNIFYLNKNPRVIVKQMTDKHIVKMILETAQILCTAHRVLDGVEVLACSTKSMRKTWIFPKDLEKEKSLYKSTHVNHPSTKWARESRENYKWLYSLFCHLCSEYQKRYGRVHLCERKLIKILFESPNQIPEGEFTEPPQAMPEEYQVEKDSILAYNQYYINEKLKSVEDRKRYHMYRSV